MRQTEERRVRRIAIALSLMADWGGVKGNGNGVGCFPAGTAFSMRIPVVAVDAALAKYGKPKGSPAVAGVNQGLRVGGPGGFDIVAGDVGESVRLAVVQIAEPKIPVSTLKLAVREPVAVWGDGRIASVIHAEGFDVSCLIGGE